MFKEISATITALVVLVLLILVAGPILWTAITTGKIPTRWAVYSRKQNPAQYYFCVMFWIFLIVLVAFASTLLLDQFFPR
jgi:hypothetical protein